MLPLKVLTSLALEVIQKNQLVAQDVAIQKRGAGSLHDVSYGVSRVSQPSGVRVRRSGERPSEGSGVRENRVSRVALPPRDVIEEDVSLRSKHGPASRVREAPLIPLYHLIGSEILQARGPRSLWPPRSNHGYKGSWFGRNLAHHGVCEARGWVCARVAVTSPFLGESIWPPCERVLVIRKLLRESCIS